MATGITCQPLVGGPSWSVAHYFMVGRRACEGPWAGSGANQSIVPCCFSRSYVFSGKGRPLSSPRET